MIKGKNVLTTGDVARICNVSPRTVSKWFDTGQLKGYRIPGSKDRRIPTSELLRFMKAHNMPLTELSFTKIRVIVAEGNAEHAKEIIAQLETKAGYDIKTAVNDFKLGTLIQKFSPHLIIVGTDSSGINAEQICKNLRADENFETIRLIAVVGNLTEQKRHKLMEAGFDDCIPADADIETIIHKIEEQTSIIY
ncbi:MAG: helix-turn-helix domain-containing protein [Phycisphaerae bacterium]|nr:helix-turn-helix domain-containing protein [Phycisphaerae bacterium]